MSDSSIVTRFAPSPTGSLHVGGARTALFNWAYARRHGGRFLLRIEDTDQARSTPEATRGILRDLKWLGLGWDEGPAKPPEADDPAYDAFDPYQHAQQGDAKPYFQSQRHEQGIYAKLIEHLIDAGRAYRCFKSKEDLDAERERARREKRPYKYDPGDALVRTKAEADALEREGKPFVVRFRMPDEVIVLADEVLGEVRFEPDQQEDFVIRKADGFPTYHLAVVADDAAMGVTDVIRGQEHLNNTAKHIALQEALGYDRPRYAHIPLIFNADGSKMSKRDKAKVAREGAKTHGLESVGFDDDRYRAFLEKKNDDMDIAGAIAEQLGLTLPEIDVDDFRKSGYLPEVLCNYLALLGWSPGDDVERFGPDPLAFICEKFSLERVGKANARFDRDKLFRFNGEAIAAMDFDTYCARLGRYARIDAPAAFETQKYFQKLGDERSGGFRIFAAAYHERSRTLAEPFEQGRFFIEDDESIVYDEKAVAKVLHKGDGDGLKVLDELRERLKDIEPFEAEAIHQLIKDHAEATGRGMGKVAQPLRVAVTGTSVSPPIDQTLALLGRESVLRRMERCLRECAQDRVG